MLQPWELIALIIIGLLAGGVGGMLGVGGSIVMIPAMTEVHGPDQHLYQAAAMIVNFFVVVPAVVQHRRAGAIDRATVFRLLPAAMVAVLAGVGLSEMPFFAGGGEAYLRAVFAAFLILAAIIELYRLATGRSRADIATREPAGTASPPQRPGSLSAAAVAVPTGLVAGMLGVGGGILAVPLQRRVLGIPIRNAIANSATIIIATSLVGATAKNVAYAQDHTPALEPLAFAAVLIPTAILGSLIGSRLTHRLPLKAVKVAFFVLLMIAAVRMVADSANGAAEPADRAGGQDIRGRVDGEPMPPRPG